MIPTNGVCPSCGSPFERRPVADANQGGVETPQTQQTPPDQPDADRIRLYEPHLTRSLVPDTKQDLISARFDFKSLPDIPNHTDLEYVGRGGMGTVFRGIQQPIQRTVAIKVMHAMLVSPPLRERFTSEVRAHAKIKHRGIVPVYEVGECGAGPYFTMDFVAGGTLADRLAAGKTPEVRTAVALIADAADAVHAAHHEGIIHRDLKPSNILIDRDGTVKVGDFGLAKHLTEAGEQTATGVVIGTPSYMSPEQARADAPNITKLSDVYGLGASLYHLLTGEAPFRSASVQATLAKVEAGPTPIPRKLKPTLCPVLDAIVQKSMARKPTDRYESAGAFAADLRRWLAGEPTVARPLTRVQRVKRFVRQNALAILLAVLIPALLAGVAISHREADPKRQIERALARGEKVTLVGPTGIPKWHEWDLGNSELTTTTIGDNSAGFQTQVLSLLRLVDDPMTDHYRVSLELRHCGRGPLAGSNVGVYFGYEKSIGVDGTPYTRLLTAKFSDYLENVELQDEEVADVHRVLVHDSLIIQRDGESSTRQAELYEPGHKTLLFQPKDDPLGKNCWRQLIVEVYPTKVTIRWILGLDANSPLTIMTVPADQIRSRWSGPIRPTPWQPRRPLGIMVNDATIAFRNVTIEPLSFPAP